MTITMHLLEPGSYFIGDPGFVIDEENWEKLITLSNFFTIDEPFEYNGQMLWGHATSSERTMFYDQNDIEYEVEDKVLAAVPVSLIENPAGEEHGTMVTAPLGLYVYFNAGVFRFNEIVIDTNETEKNLSSGYDLDPAGDHFI